MELPKTYRGL